MPEATVDENDFTTGGENNIGTAGEVRFVKSIAVSHPVDDFPNQKFRACVLTFNERHDSAALARGERIHPVPRGLKTSRPPRIEYSVDFV